MERERQRENHKLKLHFNHSFSRLALLLLILVVRFLHRPHIVKITNTNIIISFIHPVNADDLFPSLHSDRKSNENPSALINSFN